MLFLTPDIENLAKMKKGIRKTDNYFERNRITRQARNYRYNFIDYLYYQGERYGKKYISCSGNQLITLYWIGFVFLPSLPFLAPRYTDIIRNMPEGITMAGNSSSDSGDSGCSPSDTCCNGTSARFVVPVEIQERQGGGYQAPLPPKYMERRSPYVAVVDNPYFI